MVIKREREREREREKMRSVGSVSLSARNAYIIGTPLLRVLEVDGVELNQKVGD
jgi:hypothetical protein